MIVIGTDLKLDCHANGGFFVLCFWARVSLCIPDWSGTWSNLPASLNLLNIVIMGMYVASSAFSLCVWVNLLLVSIYQPFHLFSSASRVLNLQVCIKHLVPFSLCRWDSLLFLFLSHYVFYLMLWSPPNSICQGLVYWAREYQLVWKDFIIWPSLVVFFFFCLIGGYFLNHSFSLA